MEYEYIEKPPDGDHICYISNLSRFKSHYPRWEITQSLDDILIEIEVPISWINRTPDMGVSSFRLIRVGGGYWRVLGRLWLKNVLGSGAYKALPWGQTPNQTALGRELLPRQAGKAEL